jgi:branched-subunit amino acid ABC-type transport system permease component
VVLERVVIRPILGQPAFSIVMLTIGIGYVARGLITMIPNIGTETHTLPVPYKDMIWKMGGDANGIGALVINVEQVVVIAPPPCCACCCSPCSATASWASPCRPRRRTSWRPTTWAFRSRPQRPGLGPGGGGGGHCRAAAGAHHLRARQHGLHRPEGLSGGGGRRLWQPAGRHRGRAGDRLVESLSGFYLPDGFKDIAAYIVVLVMLMVKPNGLFGEKPAQEGLGPAMRFIFKTDYGQDIKLAKHGGHVFWYSAAVLLLVPRPGCSAEYWLAQLTFILIYSIVGLGLMLLAGFTGLFSIGHAAFLGVGAYTQAVLTNMGCAVSAGAGGWRGAVGRGGRGGRAAGLRVKGIYLGIATLSFGFIVEEVLARWESVTGGNAGV